MVAATIALPKLRNLLAPLLARAHRAPPGEEKLRINGARLATSASVKTLEGRKAAEGDIFLMSPFQEVLNALTMLPTACMSWHAIFHSDCGPGVELIAFGILVHFPFSFGYHVACAILHGRRHPVEGNIALRLDLVFIHVAATFMAYGTSGSRTWFFLVALFNATCSYRTALWRGCLAERRACRCVCALAYIAPILATDIVVCLWALASFVAVAVPFSTNRQLSGWGHAISHVMLVSLASALFVAASKTW